MDKVCADNACALEHWTKSPVIKKLSCSWRFQKLINTGAMVNNSSLATAHSSVALQVTGAFCILTAGFRANSQVTHFCPKSNTANCGLFNVRQHCHSCTKSLVTFSFLAKAVIFLFCLFRRGMYHL